MASNTAYNFATMFSNQTIPSILSWLVFGPPFNGTHSSVSPVVSPSVSSSTPLASPIKEVIGSALNDSIANITMSVDGGGDAGSTSSYSTYLFISTVLLVIALGFIVLCVSTLVEELDLSKVHLAALKKSFDVAREKAEKLARKSNDECFDIFLEMSDELNRLRGENADLKESKDDLQAEYDDLEPSYNAILLACDVLEHCSNTLDTCDRDLDKDYKDLHALTISLSEENADLIVSMYNLDRDRFSLRGLLARTYDENVHLRQTLQQTQDTFAEDAQQAKLSATVFEDAMTKIAVFDELIAHYKDLVASKDELLTTANNDNQALLSSLARLRDESAALTKTALDHETAIANKDIEICALRCEISLHETARSRADETITRLVDSDVARKAQVADIDMRVSVLHDRLERVSDQYASKIARQNHANKRLLNAAEEREEYIGVLHDWVEFYDERREEAERKLAWHRLAFEEERNRARGEISGAKEGVVEGADDEQHDDDGGAGLDSAVKPSMDAYELLFPPLANDATINEEDPDQFSDVADNGFTSEEDLNAFSDDASILDNTSTAHTLVLTESEASDSDFESIGLSDGFLDVDVLLE